MYYLNQFLLEFWLIFFEDLIKKIIIFKREFVFKKNNSIIYIIKYFFDNPIFS